MRQSVLGLLALEAWFERLVSSRRYDMFVSKLTQEIIIP